MVTCSFHISQLIYINFSKKLHSRNPMNSENSIRSIRTRKSSFRKCASTDRCQSLTAPQPLKKRIGRGILQVTLIRFHHHCSKISKFFSPFTCASKEPTGFRIIWSLLPPIVIILEYWRECWKIIFGFIRKLCLTPMESQLPETAGYPVISIRKKTEEMVSPA